MQHMGRNTEASFGAHTRELRKRRDLTQEQLAELAHCSPDTVRRLEHGAFSPSLRTLRKLCAGLGVSLTTLFVGFDGAEDGLAHEVLDQLRTLTPAERLAALRVLRSLVRCADLVAVEAVEVENPWPAPSLLVAEQGSDDSGA